MRLYAVEDEVRVALERRLRDWTKAGLLSPDQAHALRAGLATDLRRTGVMLRLGLAAFTVIAGAAAVGFVVLVTDLDSEVAVAITAAVLGAAALGAATVLVRRFRLYRYGVEEALAMGAVGLFGVSAAMIGTEIVGASAEAAAWALAMAAVAIAAAESYRRFGFQYAAVAAVYATALLPMAFSGLGLEFRRIAAALVCATAYVAATRVRQAAEDDVRRADAEVVRAAAAAGAYAAVNAAIFADPLARPVDGWFWWSSWAVTWLLPFVIGRAAIGARDPLLLRVAMATGLASLLTNKSYLGWPRQPWDPMLLGVGLTGTALLVRRWLAAGAGGERNGFTPHALVDSEAATLQLASVASVTVQPAAVRELPEPEDPTFSGGRSGGAGAGATF